MSVVGALRMWTLFLSRMTLIDAWYEGDVASNALKLAGEPGSEDVVDGEEEGSGREDEEGRSKKRVAWRGVLHAVTLHVIRFPLLTWLSIGLLDFTLHASTLPSRAFSFIIYHPSPRRHRRARR
jgi:hypothetical protein